MPELPEVETIVRDLRDRIIGKKIVQVEVLLKRIVKGKFNDFLTVLQYNKIIQIERRGKLIIFWLADKKHFLLIHLRMTGQLVYCKKDNIIAGGHSDKNQVACKPNPHTRVVISFADKSKLLFNDLRTFGYLQIVEIDELEKITGNFGLEAMEIDFKYLKSFIRTKTASIKTLLLNQNLIAGIGNIYADEALFLAGIRPVRPAFSLSDIEIKKLAKSIKQVLQKAIQNRGTTFNNYVDASGNKGEFVKMLNVYGRKGEECRRCGAIIQKIKVTQRGTSYCGGCQS
ncbi:MAG: Formamidopyrimidine-DNA glycosylase [Candidatus Falkowbacteria bacterium GW2011_GWC2_38_22]|uniref:Formamidopyrimidine-DNA glycosylase n=1 Tax=Candidatus Falkowbacteria bacterium GW2011_GWE1_38_31 TaxID=1618638 RepID=A0A0G0MA26_9BACT|nr:MAG: Formamidopyrimidine-DNA glycosylase [Candidatus Falkowbacteria bacterium GW2011_GWF2_38_1205]KKQ61689.1 MAG: Formamidopyrimidine-DNA glycosylase [Candidatus Falkowbacteria bacterium GW2011_GWC2_38_22]KKQ63696.1 MAG: Formamidopyrimidine-DNA glycosylase [Candidatus Falkowbacteria bacterium GW2011_GWF1_38_22]KKQ65888.1 MAG: Formamidopyrimidine-DNA glycosylase [Candidatus Falkowbacteria bacterium GW2011_GWE2_38_254]KKQ70559.1 MAG: Formamidopyrimidine-DNA glycosylase [Candidatus Falkowbacter